MGSLTNVLGAITAVGGSASATDHPLEWSKNDIQDFLEQCMTVDEVHEWHDEQLIWVCEMAKCEKLHNLCEAVAASLRTAAEKVSKLRRWAAGRALLPKHILCDRHLVNEALEDIVTAFKSFQIVASDSSLRVRHIMDMVLRYLRKVFELAIVLGNLSFPPENLHGGWFAYWTESLEDTGLKSFVFDTRESYQKSRIADVTLKGVLAPITAVPQNFLPRNPTYPALYHNKSPYGPPLLKNVLYYGGKGKHDLLQLNGWHVGRPPRANNIMTGCG